MTRQQKSSLWGDAVKCGYKCFHALKGGEFSIKSVRRALGHTVKAHRKYYSGCWCSLIHMDKRPICWLFSAIVKKPVEPIQNTENVANVKCCTLIRGRLMLAFHFAIPDPTFDFTFEYTTVPISYLPLVTLNFISLSQLLHLTTTSWVRVFLRGNNEKDRESSRGSLQSSTPREYAKESACYQLYVWETWWEEPRQKKTWM